MAEFSIPCNGTLLPTKADLANIFVKIADIPSQLQVEAEKIRAQIDGPNVDQAVREALRKKIAPIEAQAEQVREILEKVDKALGNFPISASKPYYKSLKIPDDEWERKMTALTQEYHLYVQAKILEIINNVLPVSFTIPVLGISVDIVQLFASASYRASLKQQVVDEVDALSDIMPDAYRSYEGKLGVYSKEIKAQGVWSYIMTMVKKGAIKLIHQAMAGLINKFKTIWDTLGLPPLPVLLDLGVEGIISSIVGSLKAQAEGAAEEVRLKIYQEIIDKLESINIAGYSLLDIIGGDIDDFVRSPEEKINRYVEAARDFGEAWPEFLLKKWMQKITRFLERIGLSALTEWINFDFCKFLKLIGMPTSITVNVDYNIDLTQGEASVSLDASYVET
jgi:DNA-binding ferritin-like protein (Dps family)